MGIRLQRLAAGHKTRRHKQQLRNISQLPTLTQWQRDLIRRGFTPKLTLMQEHQLRHSGDAT